MIRESVGALTKLEFLSLRDCTNLVGIPDTFYKMTSLITLDLCGCSEFTKLPLREISPSPLQSLIYLDLSFCNIYEEPKVIGELRCLERLNLQGNNFTTLPSTLSRLCNLSYLNLSHCHRLQSLPKLPTNRGPSNSVGRYFKTTSGSHKHRSGLYIFDSPRCMEHPSSSGGCSTECPFNSELLYRWVMRLVQEPVLYRCGFDIVFPWHGGTKDSYKSSAFSKLFRFHHKLKGGSIVRINNFVRDVDWVGFLFVAIFESNDHNYQSLSSPPLPHPFYLSFESENTEERFDMPLNLEQNMVDGKHYIWMIFISREHCHFVETGAQITFKACEGLIIKEWGLRVLNKEDTWGYRMGMSVDLPLQNVKVKRSRSSSRFEPKIQLPYNWLVSDKDEAEKDAAKRKEIGLSNLGLSTVYFPPPPPWFSISPEGMHFV
ncbi:putative leucine-rich repeat domain, L domain-containing protein [Medicago truncatula]|uniref:Putative leucine-rich repeat domain, L domain-containing protein n=1 Tax=Medicago truncatula TaxID=3880 RepID=A0A396H6A1_MEDTR|nr:putative leucine-rich repeat domain, L domain-containing protein [Medicago truncatula]